MARARNNDSDRLDSFKEIQAEGRIKAKTTELSEKHHQLKKAMEATDTAIKELITEIKAAENNPPSASNTTSIALLNSMLAQLKPELEENIRKENAAFTELTKYQSHPVDPGLDSKTSSADQKPEPEASSRIARFKSALHSVKESVKETLTSSKDKEVTMDDLPRKGPGSSGG